VNLRERWIRYCLKMECEICGDDIFNHEEDARSAVDHILATIDFGTPAPPIECLRDALSWSDHKGRYCDYHTHVLGKDD
jgi:hypothetical protein